MTFEEALIEMKKGKKVKLHDQNYFLSLVSKMYYDGNPDREVRILSCNDHIFRKDWEIID